MNLFNLRLVSLKQTNLQRVNLKLAGLVLITLTVSSCGGEKRPVYQGAEYYKNLEVPPDLTAPDTGDQLKIPKPTREARQRFRDNNKLETVLTPEFDGVRMVTYAGNSWIEVDNNVKQVWSEALKFWQAEGIKLVQIRPLLGFMETEWTERLAGESGFFRSLFQKFEPDQKEKFRVRVESFDKNRKTRLYIAHSRIERIVRGEDADEYTWESRPSDLEAERELISRMALYMGLSKSQSVALLDNYRPYSSLVKIERTNTTALTMKGSMDFVWRRAKRALDRMRMQDIREQKKYSSIHFVVGKVSNEELKVEDEDDISKSSWIMQLLTGTNKKNLASDKNRRYRLEFTDLKGRIQVEVKDAKDSQTSDDDGDVTGTALAEQLRNILAEKLE